MVGGGRCVERSEVSGKSGGVRGKWSVVGGVEECGGRGGGVWEGQRSVEGGVVYGWGRCNKDATKLHVVCQGDWSTCKHYCRSGLQNWYCEHSSDMNYINICFLFCGPLLIILINTIINNITEIFRLNFVHKN